MQGIAPGGGESIFPMMAYTGIFLRLQVYMKG